MLEVTSLDKYLMKCLMKTPGLKQINALDLSLKLICEQYQVIRFTFCV
jgi:hypothetical protein